jgi:hypothetical protein
VPFDGSPLQYLNAPERRVLGRLVARTFASDSRRFSRALEKNGPEATARMACVNALRGYAVTFFLLGLVGELAHSRLLTYPLMALAFGCMVWSFWCLYTMVGPERAYRRAHAAELEAKRDASSRFAGHTG